MERGKSGALGTCRAVILELRSEAVEVYGSYEQGGKGTSGSGEDVVDELDEIGQRESSSIWRRRSGRWGKETIVIVVRLDEANNEGRHSFYVEKV